MLKTVRQVSRSEIRRKLTKFSVCSGLRGKTFFADSKPDTSLILRKIHSILRFRCFNTCWCIIILLDAEFPRHSKTPRRLVHFDAENETINVFQGIRLRARAPSNLIELNPQPLNSENLEAFTYAAGALTDRSLTQDFA
jgi:hypothetical protein